MRRFGVYGGPQLAALLLSLTSFSLVGCSDDESGDDDDKVVDSGTSPVGDQDASVVGSMDSGSNQSRPDSSTPSTGSDASTPSDAGSSATFPSVLSISGCDEISFPDLCSVTQTGSNLSANCGGTKYTGTYGADRAVTLNAETKDTAGAVYAVACTGKLSPAGALAADCTRTLKTAAPAGDAGAAASDAGAPRTCKITSDALVLPGVACLELPSTLEGVSVCKEGAAAGGTTIAGGSCKIRQDGCVFQADCANDVTLTGTVTKTGVSFSQRLKALADAAQPETGSPSFMKGAEVSHTCTGTVTAGKLTGSCTAGAVRGGMPTSTCTLEGTGAAPATCSPIAPGKTELLFALNSCDILKNGEGATPGIGEPVCAFRQNGCIWDLQCGNNPLTKFGGRLTPGATKLEWRLATGTPCELSIDAQGTVTGKCTVQGQTACDLNSIPAKPGGANCPVLPTKVKSHGCGGGDPLKCRATLQHGCEYMGLCDFTTIDLPVAGKTSIEAGRPTFAFNGVGAYSCKVQKATDAEIASGDRIEYEWYGQCQTAAGGMCRDNYNAETKAGFRGLRLYFDVPEGVVVPPPAVTAM